MSLGWDTIVSERGWAKWWVGLNLHDLCHKRTKSIVSHKKTQRKKKKKEKKRANDDSQNDLKNKIKLNIPIWFNNKIEINTIESCY